jgi:uncharacterized linocin/CFP29 family protein
MLAQFKSKYYICIVNKNKQYLELTSQEDNTGINIMKTIKNIQAINEVMNEQHINDQKFLANLDNFTEFENDAQPFLIEVGKKARALSNENDRFVVKMMMKEIENCYFAALKADCGYMIHANCSKALGWLNAMITYIKTGRFEA